jgi:hypothetical protein
MKDWTQVVAWAAIFVLIPVVGMITGMVMQWFKTKERLAAIEKGIALPPEPENVRDPWAEAANYRVGGLTTVAVGLGLAALFPALAATVPNFPKGLVAVAAIPILVGLALLYEYRVRSRELGPRPKR